MAIFSVLPRAYCFCLLLIISRLNERSLWCWKKEKNEGKIESSAPLHNVSVIYSADVLKLSLSLRLFFYSNCPFSLAAALARGTADSILQSDLSVYYLNKSVEDGTDTLPRKCPIKTQLNVTWTVRSYFLMRQV